MFRYEKTKTDDKLGLGLLGDCSKTANVLKVVY